MGRNPSIRTFSSSQLRSIPYQIPGNRRMSNNLADQKEPLAAPEKCRWEDAICSVCIESPHDAVLLLCSSHDKGCRPYICATDYRQSNCLDQLRKAQTEGQLGQKVDGAKIACPLCRGEVKGCTVVEPAREHLNGKQRSCSQDGCSYVGTFGELCEHVESEHPGAKPLEVDPMVLLEWRILQLESSVQDAVSLFRSTSRLHQMLSRLGVDVIDGRNRTGR